MPKHKCKAVDLISVSGNDEEFISCSKCNKEFTKKEADKLERKDEKNN